MAERRLDRRTELWKTDGTTPGTVPAEVSPGPAGPFPSGFAVTCEGARGLGFSPQQLGDVDPAGSSSPTEFSEGRSYRLRDPAGRAGARYWLRAAGLGPSRWYGPDTARG